MKKKELQKISLKYRTLSAQLLKVNNQNEMYCIQQFYDFINDTPFLISYIHSCKSVDYDFKKIFSEKEWNSILSLPSNEKELVSYGYQLLEFILDGPKNLFGLCYGYSSSNKFSDNIEAFMRKSIEPFVVALRTYIELEFIDLEDKEENSKESRKTIFLSYCQKDADVANYLEEKVAPFIEGKAVITRDVRDVDYHENFKKFMNSIEKHDFVITLISDRYLKSRNCMYEMLEVIKDSEFSQRLVFIVLREEDKAYYTSEQILPIEAMVYSSKAQADYIKYWNEELNVLDNKINEIGDSTFAISQIKEKKIVQKILFDLPDFLEFVQYNKGLSINEHIAENFESMLSFMKINEEQRNS